MDSIPPTLYRYTFLSLPFLNFYLMMDQAISKYTRPNEPKILLDAPKNQKYCYFKWKKHPVVFFEFWRCEKKKKKNDAGVSGGCDARSRPSLFIPKNRPHKFFC